MDDPTLSLALLLAAVFSVAAAFRFVLFGERGIITRKRQEEIRKLEVRVRTSGNEEVIDDMLALARGYSQVGKLNEAERTLRQALALTEQEFGKTDGALVPVLETYSQVLAKMNRSAESKKMKERMKSIKTGRPFEQTTFKRSRR